MPTADAVHVPLTGLVLADTAGGFRDLGDLDGTWLVTAIRHRF